MQNLDLVLFSYERILAPYSTKWVWGVQLHEMHAQEAKDGDSEDLVHELSVAIRREMV